MTWLILWDNKGKSTASAYTDINKAMNMLMWLKQMRLIHHIIYGVEAITFDDKELKGV